ncbi:MAG: universal stress protein [Candidatus Sericytochromatia bacterium]
MKILFTTDGSPCSDMALREGCRLLSARGAEALVVAVLEPVVYAAGYEGMGAGLTAIIDQEATRLGADLDKARATLAELGVQATVRELEGDPAAQILAAAAEFQPDVIVMGSHGRGAIGRLMLGSVSDQVLHHWAGSVLIIRPSA